MESMVILFAPQELLLEEGSCCWKDQSLDHLFDNHCVLQCVLLLNEDIILNRIF
jgi:hypothetical protein